MGKTFAHAVAGEGLAVRAFVDIDPRKIGRRVAGAPVLAPAALADPRWRDALCLAAVGQPGARVVIRASAAELGRNEGVDFVAVA